MPPKKLYCPQCKIIYTPETTNSESAKICPQCAKNIEEHLPKKVRKIEGNHADATSDNSPKKLMVVDLNKIPEVISRTSDAKNHQNHLQDFSRASPKKEKGFKNEFLDLNALKKRQLDALQRPKNSPESVSVTQEEEEEDEDDLKGESHSEIAFERLNKEAQPSPEALTLDSPPEAGKIPENKQELLEKIDFLIQKNKEDSESPLQKKKAEPFFKESPKSPKKELNPPQKKLPFPPKNSSEKPQPSLSTSLLVLGIVLAMYIGFLQWEIWRVKESLRSFSLPPATTQKDTEEQKISQLSPSIEANPFQLEEQIRRALDLVAPSVVSIQKEYSILDHGQKITQHDVGSGFFFHKDGYILTNYHVIDQAEQLWCFLSDGRKFRGELLAGDPLLDIAVLRLDTPKQIEIKVAPLGDSNSLAQGQFVFALGNPAGFSNSFSFGVISHSERYLPKVSLELSGFSSGEFNTWIQVDTPINQGNSGGPLFNLKGEVIGINTRTLVHLQNISFALPIHAIQEEAQRLINQSSIERAFLGLVFREISRSQGVLIAHVLKGSPAEKAGFQREDILLELGPYAFRATQLNNLPEIYRNLSQLTSGKSVKALVERRQNRVKLEVIPRLRESFDNQLSEFHLWGFSGIPISEALRNYLGDISAETGIYVATVEPDSIFAQHKISTGSVISEINYKKISFFKDFKQEYDNIYQNKLEQVVLSILREDGISEVLTLNLNYH